MAINTIIYITNSEINSGQTINMLADNISTNWEVFSRVKAKPHTDASNSYDTKLNIGINTGYNNPTHTISGKFNINTPHGSTAGALIDFEFIKELINRSDKVMQVTCDKFKTTGNPTGNVDIMITGYTDRMDNSNQIQYTLKVIEVNSLS